MILEVVRPSSRLYLLKIEHSKGSNTTQNNFFFRLICTKSICICHCLQLSCREGLSVFISVSHFRFQFQPEDRVFFELSDIEKLTSFKLRTANRAPPRFPCLSSKHVSQLKVEFDQIRAGSAQQNGNKFKSCQTAVSCVFSKE